MARITHTPREGYMLLPSGEVVVPGMLIAAEMRTGDNVNGGVKLTYMPKPHSTGFFADSFGYYVTDGQYRTEPMEFSFDIDATGIASRRSGFGGAVAAGTSFGMYFKTSNAMGAEAVLATVGPMSLKFDDLEDALTFHCGSSTKVSSKENFNDGLWHFVSASCNSSFAELMVDGKSYGTKATQHFPESTETCGDYEQTGAFFSRESPSQFSCPNLMKGGFCEHASFGPLIRGLCSMSCGTCGKYYDDKDDVVATLNPIKGPIALGNVATKTASGNYTAGSSYGFQGEIDEFVIRTGHTAAEFSDTLYSIKAPLDVVMKDLFLALPHERA
ncbi:LAM_G_DOMAIN domain-containing protein [Pseudoscourfieldia marina]